MPVIEPDVAYDDLKRKADARRAVRNALRSGRLTKRPCWICGDDRSEAHHPDYSRPLDVEWLCRKHHRAAHSQPLPTDGWDLNHGGSSAARRVNTLSTVYPHVINAKSTDI